MKRRISEEEIERLYTQYETPPHVIRHCRAVTRVALLIAEALNDHGYHLDTTLIQGAGLAHDVARVEEEHWNVGADALLSLGYADEANIIRNHMFYEFDDVDKLDETDLVCLGDRLVKEACYVGVDERFQYIMNKAPHRPDIQAKLIEKREKMRNLLSQIEDIIGISIDELVTGEKKDERN